MADKPLIRYRTHSDPINTRDSETDVSSLLDQAFGTTVGTTLVRAKEGWISSNTVVVAGGIAAWGSTPLSSQFTALDIASGYTPGNSTSVTIDGVFTGGTGSTAYTIGDLVAALKAQGLIAS